MRFDETADGVVVQAKAGETKKSGLNTKKTRYRTTTRYRIARMPYTVYENRRPLIMERSKIIFYFQSKGSVAWIQ